MKIIFSHTQHQDQETGHDQSPKISQVFFQRLVHHYHDFSAPIPFAFFLFLLFIFHMKYSIRTHLCLLYFT